MNPIYYTTLKQSKRLKELGVQQEVSDCVWIKLELFPDKWLLVTRGQCYGKEDGCEKEMEALFSYDKSDGNFEADNIIEWYAAFNLQEIFVSGDNFNIINIQGYFYIRTRDMVLIGRADEAQSMADAKIWELENKK